MCKIKNLTVVEEEMFKFLRKSFQISRREIKPELEKLLSTIKHLEHNRFETRSFAYLDIISWLESKVAEKTMSDIIHAKYSARKKRRLTEGLAFLPASIHHQPSTIHDSIKP